MEAKVRGHVCGHCGVGRRHPQHIQLRDIVHGHLLTVPNMPVYICDVCHFVEIDQEAMVAFRQRFAKDLVDQPQLRLSVEHFRPYDEGSG